MAPKAKKKSPKSRSTKSNVLVSLIAPDQTYKATAPTIIEALEKLKVPTYFKGKSIIRVTSGKMSSEITAYPFFLRRLFVNRIAREILQKRMAAALK